MHVEQKKQKQTSTFKKKHMAKASVKKKSHFRHNMKYSYILLLTLPSYTYHQRVMLVMPHKCQRKLRGQPISPHSRTVTTPWQKKTPQRFTSQTNSKGKKYWYWHSRTLWQLESHDTSIVVLSHLDKCRQNPFHGSGQVHRKTPFQ